MAGPADATAGVLWFFGTCRRHAGLCGHRTLSHDIQLGPHHSPGTGREGVAPLHAVRTRPVRTQHRGDTRQAEAPRCGASWSTRQGWHVRATARGEGAPPGPPDSLCPSGWGLTHVRILGAVGREGPRPLGGRPPACEPPRGQPGRCSSATTRALCGCSPGPSLTGSDRPEPRLLLV